MTQIVVPSLVDTAQILAAVATLIALPVAWHSYKEDERRSRDALKEGVRNVLTGLRPEMELVRHYAEANDGKGYPPHGDDVATYRHYHDTRAEWLNPLRALTPIVYPAIASLPLSRYAAQVGPLVQEFGLLSSAIAALAKAEDGRLAFVMQSSALMIRMRRLWNEPNQTPTKEELDFIESVFYHNFAIHVQIIGSAESKHQNTLFRAYKGAREALDRFETTWEGALPTRVWWHGLADVVSWLMLGAAAAIFAVWLWTMLPSLPELLRAMLR